MNDENLIACHECDALYSKPRLSGKSCARCLRCGAILYRGMSRRLDGICALTLASLVTFVIALGSPILELETGGITSRTSLFGALVTLWNEDMQLVAAMVFCSTVLFPLTELAALLYVLVAIRHGYVPPAFNRILRAIQFVRPWGMIEVFMLGVLVTIVKMVSLARVVPGAALFAFGALTLMLLLVVMFDPRTLWDLADDISDAARRANKAHAPPPAAHRPAARPTA
uniref:Paraquat-inducible protein A n=1 Tax=Burkholderia sp. (strain CCGE1003) TaxID=640512 RepID=E1TK53_BURSG